MQTAGKCLDTAGGGTAPGTLTALATCNGSASQVWTPTPQPSGPAVNLVNGASGLCLDDPGGNTVSGTALDIATCNSTANAQKWVLPTY
jgi:hypothetical protein